MIFGGDQSIAIPASIIRKFLEKAGGSKASKHIPEGVL